MSRTPQKTLLCLKLLIPFCLIWSTILYFYRFPLQKPVPDQSYLYDTASQDDKAKWIKQALESEVDGNFDSSSITALCGTKTWLPGLVITCDITEKSIADIRNVFLNCLRYSIEAGGVSCNSHIWKDSYRRSNRFGHPLCPPPPFRYRPFHGLSGTIMPPFGHPHQLSSSIFLPSLDSRLT
jgi:hypothetical protein